MTSVAYIFFVLFTQAALADLVELLDMLELTGMVVHDRSRRQEYTFFPIILFSKSRPRSLRTRHATQAHTMHTGQRRTLEFRLNRVQNQYKSEGK